MASSHWINYQYSPNGVLEYQSKFEKKKLLREFSKTITMVTNQLVTMSTLVPASVQCLVRIFAVFGSKSWLVSQPLTLPSTFGPSRKTWRAIETLLCWLMTNIGKSSGKITYQRPRYWGISKSGKERMVLQSADELTVGTNPMLSARACPFIAFVLKGVWEWESLSLLNADCMILGGGKMMLLALSSSFLCPFHFVPKHCANAMFGPPFPSRLFLSVFQPI